jgi:phage shock protein C
MNKAKRLYRSRTDRQFAGVCGGIADYLAIDPTLIRILWVILALAGGPGLILYIILMLVVPEEPEFVQASVEKIKNDDEYV